MRYHPVTWHKKTFNSRVACILYARSRDLGTSGMLMLCVSLVCLVGLGATLPEALGPRGALGQVAGHPSIQSALPLLVGEGVMFVRVYPVRECSDRGDRYVQSACVCVNMIGVCKLRRRLGTVTVVCTRNSSAGWASRFT